MDETEIDIGYIEMEADTTCSICFAEFLDLEDLEIHKRQMHPTGLVLCQFCTQIQASAEDYAVHIRDKHLNDLRMCQFCTRVFIDDYCCKKHQKKHLISSDNAMYACSQCNLKFSNVGELEKHEFISHKSNIVSEGLWLQEHMPHLSSVFNMNFISLLLLGNTKSKYICTKCGTSARTMEGYVEHLKNSDCRSLVCDVCCNVYRTKKGLVKHLSARSGCNYYMYKNTTKKCKECFKEVGVHLWKYHKRKCKPFKCNKCQIVYESMEELSKHQTEEHPFVISLENCKYCKKEFVGKLAIEKHIERAHKVDLYKYRCVYCDMVFKHPQKLFGHFYSKHKHIEPYWCKICDKKFKIRKNFTIHIKLEHKSVGFVEFNEKFHVYFTDKKSEKPKTDKSSNTNVKETTKTDANPRSLNIFQEFDTNEGSATQGKPHAAGESLDFTKQSETDVESEITASEVLIEIDKNALKSDAAPTETEAQTEAPTDVETKSAKTKIVRPKRMIRSQKAKLENKSDVEEIGSDSSDDEPLLTLKNKIKKRAKPRTRRVWKSLKASKSRFTCKYCNTYCHTFQNYHHHMNTAHQNEKVQCVKCLQIFSSKAKLSEHIKQKHSSSKLTETLKNILAKRNSRTNFQANATDDSLTNTEKFSKTIRKVDFDVSEDRATLTPLSKGISVQKFIESFTPEPAEPKKEIMIESHITIKNVNGPPKPPLIKLTKFQPKPCVNISRTKLAMPVKFKGDSEQHKVTIKMVQAEKRPLFIDQYQTETYYDNHDFGHYEEMVTEEKSDHIPDVAQEVMLEVSEETPKAVHKVVIPKIPDEIDQIRIATLLPQAPYYKILKINDVLKNPPQTTKPPKKEKEVVLPNGTKLVNVNPLAHLLGDTPVEKVFENMSTYKYYQPKQVDFEKAVAKALMNEKPPRKKRKTKVEP